MRKLSDLTLEELWELFPIILEDHNELWKSYYEEEKNNLIKLIPNLIRISHIGSTYIKNIKAKPIVDILIEISKEEDIHSYIDILENNGYICMNKQENRVSFNKGYTINGFLDKVYHIHIRYHLDNDELYFRDYLELNKEVSKEYETLKISLAKDYKHNRDKYTDLKTDFIKKYTNIAKELFKDKYK